MVRDGKLKFRETIAHGLENAPDAFLDLRAKFRKAIGADRGGLEVWLRDRRFRVMLRRRDKSSLGSSHMSVCSVPVPVNRWTTFVLTVGYSAYQLGTGDWSNPGGPLRFLTIWALLLSTIMATRMLNFCLGCTLFQHLM